MKKAVMYYYALSIKQPWASLVVSGRKRVEIRRWITKHRGPLLIHAAQVDDDRIFEGRSLLCAGLSTLQQRGGVIGAVQIVDCISYPNQPEFDAHQIDHHNPSEWFQLGLHGFVFERAIQLPFFQFKGNVRLFRVPIEVNSDLEKQLRVQFG